MVWDFLFNERPSYRLIAYSSRVAEAKEMRNQESGPSIFDYHKLEVCELADYEYDSSPRELGQGLPSHCICVGLFDQVWSDVISLDHAEFRRKRGVRKVGKCQLRRSPEQSCEEKTKEAARRLSPAQLARRLKVQVKARPSCISLEAMDKKVVSASSEPPCTLRRKV